MNAQERIGKKAQLTLYRNLTPAQAICKSFAAIANETAEAAEFVELPEVLADTIAEAGGAGMGLISATGERDIFSGELYDIDSLKVEMKHILIALLAMAYAVERETGEAFDLVGEVEK